MSKDSFNVNEVQRIYAWHEKEKETVPKVSLLFKK